MKSPRLASLSLNALHALRDKIDKVIGKRIAEEAAGYRRKLAELAGLDGDRPRRGRPPKVDGRKGKRAKAKVKYRGPKLGEKWSGRGLMPRWMAAYVKAGKKKESFLVKKA